MRILTSIAAISITAMGLTAGLPAQQNPADAERPETESRGATLFWAEGGSHVTVTGAPFTATLSIETTQTLADGNHVVTRSTQKLARDSKGRTRHEQVIGRIGGLQLDGPTLIFISDPVAQLAYTLDPALHTARITKLRPLAIAALERKDAEPRASSAQTRQVAGRQLTSEPLGSRVIEGYTTEGTRVTVTFPAGLFGNERPFSTSVEVWFSSDLHEDVWRKRIDPRTGETVSRLTNIQRVEPDPSLFQIPGNYTVISDPEPQRSKE